MPVDPVDISQWRTLIIQGKLDECLEEVSLFTNQYGVFMETCNTLLFRKNALRREAGKGKLRNEEIQIESNKIRDGLQDLINDIHKSILLQSPTKNFAPVSENEQEFRETLGLVLPPEISNLELLSKGDYNIVYKATRYAGTDLEDEIAIKAFKNISLIQDENAKSLEHRFGLAQKYSKMDGIVTIFSNSMEVFPQFYTMRYIKGLDLDDYLDQDWPMSLKEIKYLLRNIGKALKKGHQDDLLHLNLRPSNIKIDQDGDPQLLPFQIVQFNFSRRNIKRIKNLITYWSPEQVNGEDLSGQTDQYAMGLVAFELFAKKPLFEGDSVLSIMKRRFEVTQSLLEFYEKGTPDILLKELENTNCPEFFIDTIRQMLHPDPGLRFLDMDELLDEIEEISAPRTKINPDFRLLKRSFSKCRKQENFYASFYQLFFEKRPAYEALFDKVFLSKEKKKGVLPGVKEVLDEKKKKARWQFQHKILDLAMDRILLFHEEKKSIKARIENLAKSHLEMGIPAEDFGLFLDCLKETIAKTDEKSWQNSEELEKVWKSFCKPVLDIMKKVR